MNRREARKAIREAKLILVYAVFGKDLEHRFRVTKGDALLALESLPEDDEDDELFFQWGLAEYGWMPKTLLIN